MSEERLKALEEEIAYLRKEIENFVTVKPVEIHYHYTYDYGKIKEILDNFREE